ncbi:MAG: dipeptide ABC transporter ATP-binding protein, partial [Burkholderiaceae bacterium]|nr:dipeptide ABC transporter ATP-binding protein [Burkholderiaceae bacterium]
GMSKRQALVRAEELLNEVGIPDPKRRLHSYPHEMSGGQQQRVMIAVALACSPKLLIADEPTTALDVTIQRQVMELLAKLKETHKMSLLFISHDLGVVGEISDQVVVMRHGEIREKAPVAQIFKSPQDSYTKALLACRPSLEENPDRLMVIDDHIAGRVATAAVNRKDPNAPVILEAKGLKKSFFFKSGLFSKKEFVAVKDVNFKLRKGYTLGVVGESGSGKTTMGLTLLRLHEPTGGEVLFEGKDLLKMSGPDWQQMRRRIQVVFQNPYASLNPRFTIAQTLVEPMEIHNIGKDHEDRLARASALLKKVGLDDSVLGKYPHEFSGGQRQRIAIARCLTLNPEVLVLDESVSALDVSVQAQVLNLLKDLQDEFGLSYIFISHDLAVVKFISDEVLVMQNGDVVEQSETQALLKNPKQEYTRRLLGAVPRGYQPAAVTANAA